VLWSSRYHGPLPQILLGLTLLTGVVDAVSVLALGRVFVANMTGNIVFIGFALAGAPGFSLSASLSALAGFLVGAAFGGLLIGRLGEDRGSLLRAGSLIELLLMGCALAISVYAGPHLDGAARDTIAALAATAMGIQNAVARRLAVPDLTTTVLTMTRTGIAADLHTDRWHVALVRRLLTVIAMFVGAVMGAVLVLHHRTSVALGLAVALLAIVSIASLLAASRPGEWRKLKATG
jgi:uncharacterized membrane protein YoaK (UPF0700 family)